MIYLYILTTSQTVSESVVDQIKSKHPQRLKRDPVVLGTRVIPEGLPMPGEDSVMSMAINVCKDAGLRFDQLRDDLRYFQEEIEGGVYGVLEIDVPRYLKVSVGVAGLIFFVVGLALGVTSVSVWLLTAGLGGFLVHLWLRGPARSGREGWLFALGPAVLISWVLGFLVRGVVT